MRECHSCGSPLEGEPLARSWVCAYCKTVNYNEAFLQQHIAKTDFSKTHNLLQVGLTAYEGGDYKKALDVLERLLLEDTSNVDAWVYSALATAFLADMSNYENSASKAGSFLKKAESMDSSADIVKVGRSVSANTLGKVAIRIVERQYEDAKKAWFSYESVDKDRAARQTNEELNQGLRYASHALSLGPDDLRIAGRIAVLTVLSDRLYKGINPHKGSVTAAQTVLTRIQQVNPALYAEYAKELTPPKEKKGCAGQAVALLVTGAIAAVSVVTILVASFTR